MFNSRKLLQAAVCLSLLTLATPIVSFAATENFRVNLIATIDNGPAMESVEWRVLRHSGQEVKRVNKHSTHVNIPPGDYKVVARLTSSDKRVVRTRNFRVRTNLKVIVPMDH